MTTAIAGPTYQPLPSPAVPTPERMYVDVSTEPWDGDKGRLGDAGRDVIAVPRALATHVIRSKTVAAAQVAREAPKLEGLMPRLRTATAAHRADLTKLNADRQAAAEAGATGAQLHGVDGLQLAARRNAQVGITAASKSVITEARADLAKAERAATDQLTDLPSHRASTDDYRAATELLATLDLLPARLALPLLEERLVTQPAKSGESGLTVAALPLLRALYERNEEYGTPEMDDLLRQAEIVTRDATYYAAHGRLRAVGTLRAKLDMLEEQYLAVHGDEAAPGFLANKSGWFMDLGVLPPNRASA